MGDLTDENMWYSFLGKVMSIPGVKVNRAKFLRERFAKYCSEDKIMAIIENDTHEAGIPLELIDKFADKVISQHKTMAVGASALSGIPGGFAVLATIPADLAQYYYHVLQVAQKLAYIYGYPDLEQGGDEDFLQYMTIFIGVMSGNEAAVKIIQEISKNLSEQILKRLPRIALTKTTIYPLAKQIARWLGIKITKPIFARGIAKLVPLIGALLSGGLTMLTFSIETSRFKDNLRKDFILRQKTNAET